MIDTQHIIEFDEAEHKYTVDGVRKDSVTQMLKKVGLGILGNFRSEAMENACRFGTKVHKDCEIYAETGANIADSETEIRVKSFIKWVEDYEVEFIATEWVGYSPKMDICGTIDIIATIPRKHLETKLLDGQDPEERVLVIADIKTGKGLYKYYIYQLAAYGILYNKPEAPTYLLHLREDGEYDFIDSADLAKDYKKEFDKVILSYKGGNQYEDYQKPVKKDEEKAKKWKELGLQISELKKEQAKIETAFKKKFTHHTFKTTEFSLTRSFPKLKVKFDIDAFKRSIIRDKYTKDEILEKIEMASERTVTKASVRFTAVKPPKDTENKEK